METATASEGEKAGFLVAWRWSVAVGSGGEVLG
jgi:hypothetical protein